MLRYIYNSTYKISTTVNVFENRLIESKWLEPTFGHFLLSLSQKMKSLVRFIQERYKYRLNRSILSGVFWQNTMFLFVFNFSMNHYKTFFCIILIRSSLSAFNRFQSSPQRIVVQTNQNPKPEASWHHLKYRYNLPTSLI